MKIRATCPHCEKLSEIQLEIGPFSKAVKVKCDNCEVEINTSWIPILLFEAVERLQKQIRAVEQ